MVKYNHFTSHPGGDSSIITKQYLRDPAALQKQGRFVPPAVGVVVLDDLDGLVVEVKVEDEQPRLFVLPLAEEPQDFRRVRIEAVLGRQHPLVGPKWIRPLNLHGPKM